MPTQWDPNYFQMQQHQAAKPKPAPPQPLTNADIYPEKWPRPQPVDPNQFQASQHTNPNPYQYTGPVPVPISSNTGIAHTQVNPDKWPAPTGGASGGPGSGQSAGMHIPQNITAVPPALSQQQPSYPPAWDPNFYQAQQHMPGPNPAFGNQFQYATATPFTNQPQPTIGTGMPNQAQGNVAQQGPVPASGVSQLPYGSINAIEHAQGTSPYDTGIVPGAGGAGAGAAGGGGGKVAKLEGGGGGGGAAAPVAAPPVTAAPPEMGSTDLASLFSQLIKARPGMAFKIPPALQKWLSSSGLYGNLLTILNSLGITGVGSIGPYGFETDFLMPQTLANIDLSALMAGLTPADKLGMGWLLESLGLSTPEPQGAAIPPQQPQGGAVPPQQPEGQPAPPAPGPTPPLT